MKNLKNQNGNVLIIVLGLTAVIAMVIVTIISRSQSGQKVQQQTNLSGVADQIKATLVGAVMSPQSWQVIQQRNSQAFSSSSYSPGGQGGSGGTMPVSLKSLNIYLGDSQEPYYAATNPSAGFDLTGKPCSRDQTFKIDQGDDQCPFRYNVYLLSHVFHNNAWVDTIRFELLFRPKNLNLVMKEKSDRYTFNLVRNIDENNVEATCKSLNGTYSKDTGACSRELAQDVSCPHGQSYSGPGGTQCVVMKVAAKGCGGLAITGFDKQGNPICAVGN